MKIMKFKCYSCDSEASPDNPVMWLGIPTYCKPCYERICDEGRWRGFDYYTETGEEFPK